MTADLLASLRDQARRCYWCGCHPPEQPHADDCGKPANLSHTWRPAGFWDRHVEPPPKDDRPW